MELAQTTRDAMMLSDTIANCVLTPDLNEGALEATKRLLAVLEKQRDLIG